LEKNAFISVLKRYNSTTDGEVATVIELRKQFPYSQVLQSLAARLTKDHAVDSHQTILQDAAIYSADRNALKEIFFAPFVPFKQEDVAAEKPLEVARVSVEPVQQESVAPTDLKGENVLVLKVEERRLRSIDNADQIDYADEIMRDLEKLNTLKHNFEMLFVEYSEIETKSNKTVKGAQITPEHNEIVANDGQASNASDLEVETKKSKKARIVELAKNLASSGISSIDSQDPKKSSKRKNPEALIDEIQLTKEELAPESEKQKEQIEMINQFMRTQPSISAAKERQSPPIGDLNPIKSGEFGDNIVSETLVEILIKQGKKEKAIEVLKKLIWKYPQKKTYFASQIEDLKK
jgi:hypothetical protein